jgi:hypothetical protein
MILTPNITIDVDNLNAFNQQCAEYSSAEGSETKHWGSDEFANATIRVKQIRTPQGNGLFIVVSNKKEVCVVCRLIAAPVPQGALPWGRKIYVMDRIRVHNNYIGRGFAPAIYRWLARNGYTIMSDSHQNQNSLAVWRKLAATEKVYTININDGMWRPYDPLKVEDWMLFGNGDQSKYWPIRFVIPAN